MDHNQDNNQNPSDQGDFNNMNTQNQNRPVLEGQ